MSGNKTFRWQAQSLKSKDSLYGSSSKLPYCDCDYPKFSLDSFWENIDCNTENEDLVEDVIWSKDYDKGVAADDEQAVTSTKKGSIETVFPKVHGVPKRKTALPIIKKSPEIRMQEIEDIVMQHDIFRNIDGNLCMWNGRYYRQLNALSFLEEVRRIMPKEQLDRVSRFGRFREAYDYMMANEKLKRQFTSDDMATAKHMIVFQNGMYNAEKDKLIASSSKYPVLFEVNAHYLGEGRMETPYMDSIIRNATQNDREILRRFYQCLGYIYAQGNEAKKFFVFGTAADSGKSIIGEFIGKTLGSDNIASVPLGKFGDRFSLGNISQKVLNYDMDLPAGKLDEAVVQKLKQLTGDARIACEEKFVQGRTVIHHCKFLFATNHPIRLKQSDEAFYRRMILIPFMHSVADEDKDYRLLDKLWEERDAIVTKAAHAYRELYRDNFIFAESGVADDMRDAWSNTCDSGEMKKFFDRYVEVLPGDNTSFVPTEGIFKCYQQYCEENGRIVLESEKPQFSKKFRKEFNIPSAKRRVAGYDSPVNGYIGIRLQREI